MASSVVVVTVVLADTSVMAVAVVAVVVLSRVKSWVSIP